MMTKGFWKNTLLNLKTTKMKYPKRFTRAIKALYDAFFEGTLAKDNCAACAVGNIVAAGYGKKVKIIDNDLFCDIDNAEWSRVFHTGFSGRFLNLHHLNGSAADNISKTGYSYIELAEIEHAFESNTKIAEAAYCEMDILTIMDDQYNGLMAVIKVLCEIENIEDVEYWQSNFEFDDSGKSVKELVLV